MVYELDGSIGSLIEETRVDPYVMVSGKRGAFAWEAGLRYETTKSDIRYREDGEDEGQTGLPLPDLAQVVAVRIAPFPDQAQGVVADRQHRLQVPAGSPIHLAGQVVRFHAGELLENHPDQGRRGH